MILLCRRRWRGRRTRRAVLRTCEKEDGGKGWQDKVLLENMWEALRLGVGSCDRYDLTLLSEALDTFIQWCDNPIESENLWTDTFLGLPPFMVKLAFARRNCYSAVAQSWVMTGSLSPRGLLHFCFLARNWMLWIASTFAIHIGDVCCQC